MPMGCRPQCIRWRPSCPRSSTNGDAALMGCIRVQTDSLSVRLLVIMRTRIVLVLGHPPAFCGNGRW